MTRPIRIMLVDNNPTFLYAATEFLSREKNLQITGTASGGQEALTVIKKMHPDVVLLDLAMPDMNGLDAIPLLRDELPGVCIVVLTLLDSEKHRQASESAGAHSFVPKSNLVTDLVPEIYRLAGRA